MQVRNAARLADYADPAAFRAAFSPESTTDEVRGEEPCRAVRFEGRARLPGGLSVIISERRQLINLAYRLLGSLTEAEDAVQETYARWYARSAQQQDAIENPGVWLSTVPAGSAWTCSARHAPGGSATWAPGSRAAARSWVVNWRRSSVDTSLARPRYPARYPASASLLASVNRAWRGMRAADGVAAVMGNSPVKAETREAGPAPRSQHRPGTATTRESCGRASRSVADHRAIAIHADDPDRL
jgi:Sigma-70 region 2